MEKFVTRILSVVACVLLTLAMFCGCGENKGTQTVTPRGESAASASDPAKEQTEEEVEEATVDEADISGLFMIESFDGDEEYVILKNLTSTRLVRYGYNLDTKFLNKYGDVESWSSFTPGKVVEVVESAALDSTLAEIKLTDRVWIQENVTNYEIDLSRDIFKIADSNYRLTPQTEVFSHGISSYITDVGAEDELRVVGKGKEIYSITVTSGHGYISLVNTSLFEGSLITVGDETVALITENAMFEVPEGTYDVTVANNGYGGTKTVTVERNQTMTLDLNELKGEGPKFCKITFVCKAENATMYLDGKVVDINSQQDVQYGRHSLVVTAENYDTWSRTLFVNSPSATILLDLEDETKSSSNNSSSNSNNNSSNSNNSSSNSNSSTTSNNNSSTSSNTNSYTEKDATLDYLTTLSDSISKMLGN